MRRKDSGAQRLNERESVAKQAIFTRTALITEEIARDFGHFETPGDVDIMLRQGTVILQYRR